MPHFIRYISSCLWSYRALLTVVLLPVLLSPLVFVLEGKESQCGFLMLIMGVFWCSEILPLAITALLPVVFLPLFEIMTTADVCSRYMASLLMLLIGGVLMALAIEKCDLHKRIAIRIVMLVGTKPQWLMVGFMLPSWFMSMWINNTAAAAMMIPIIDAVMQQLRNPAVKVNASEDGDITKGQEGIYRRKKEEARREIGHDQSAQELKMVLMAQENDKVPEVEIQNSENTQPESVVM